MKWAQDQPDGLAQDCSISIAGDTAVLYLAIKLPIATICDAVGAKRVPGISYCFV